MSSSSNSSRSSSLATSRATTPSSETWAASVSLLTREVVLSDQALDPDTLRRLFHYYNRNIALVVGEDAHSPDGDAGWEFQPGTNVVPAHFKCTQYMNLLKDMDPCVAGPKEYGRQLHIVGSAGLRVILSIPLSSSGIVHILEQPSVVFPPLSSTPGYSPGHLNVRNCRGNIPTLGEWRTLWKAWDLVTLQMIPEDMLHQKPIDLRHKCLFYIGHIPTFLDMLLFKAIGGAPTEPAYFWNIFERGIDPHVDNPDHCHNHSEVPEKDEDWPPLDSIIAFRDRVRARLIRLYEELDSGERVLNRNIARTLVMTLEHEGFHVETLLYMLIQRAGSGTLPPPEFHVPDWDALVEQWHRIPSPSSSSVFVGPAQFNLGHDDSEADDKNPSCPRDIVDHTFGWDNESPTRVIYVECFKVDWRPITNSEYETFCRETDRQQVPKSWIKEGSQYNVRTLYGPVSMLIAGDWPVLASYDELLGYARFKGGRLPTEAELRLFLNTYDVGHEGGSNTGFRNWHPVPATTGIKELEGKGSNGGVWEWTSTVFDAHGGLVPTNIFPGYSNDFFDTKHHVVLGASYATIPRLAERRTVRNFYQHNYPYPWASARVVYDVL